jgi:dCMP deaminase
MRPTRDEMLMTVAQAVAERSTCNRLHVGAVVAREGRMVVSGYNGPPSGMPHCGHRLDLDTPAEACIRAVHAEANAIAFAARYGSPTEGAEMYVTHSPCVPCAQLIVNSGIVRVVYGTAYRLRTGLDLLEDAGIEVTRAGPKDEHSTTARRT